MSVFPALLESSCAIFIQVTHASMSCDKTNDATSIHFFYYYYWPGSVKQVLCTSISLIVETHVCSFQLNALPVVETHEQQREAMDPLLSYPVCMKISTWKESHRPLPTIYWLSFHLMSLLSHLFKNQIFPLPQIPSGSTDVSPKCVLAVKIRLEG